MTEQEKKKTVNVEDMQAFGKVIHNKGIGSEGTCSTAAGTAAKTVTVGTTFSPVAGATLIVLFQNGISVASPTLAVTYTDGSGTQQTLAAKPIYYRGAAIAADMVKEGAKIILRYDGTNFNVVGDLDQSHLSVPLSQKGSAGGVASLDENGMVPSEQLPSYVDDVVELLAITDTAPEHCAKGDLYFNTTTSKVVKATATDTWGTGSTTNTDPEKGKIYVNLTNDKSYRWSGSAMIEISSSDVTGIKVGSSGSTISPSQGVITIPAYEEGAQVNPTSGTAAEGGTDLSLVTTGEKYRWNDTYTESEADGRFYGLDCTNIESRATSEAHYDLNNLTDIGTYGITHNDNAAYFDNKPVAEEYAFKIVVEKPRVSQGYIRQTFTFSNVSNYRYVRYSNNSGSTWGSWKKDLSIAEYVIPAGKAVRVSFNTYYECKITGKADDSSILHISLEGSGGQTTAGASRNPWKCLQKGSAISWTNAGTEAKSVEIKNGSTETPFPIHVQIFNKAHCTFTEIDDLTGTAVEDVVATTSDIPTTLPASDVSAWAKAANKPSYTLDEVTDGSTRKLSDYLPAIQKTAVNSTSAKWSIFAKISSSTTSRYNDCIALVQGLGYYYNGENQGAWIVEMRTTNAAVPKMTATCLSPKGGTGTVEFGYYIDSEAGFIYYGVKTSTRRGAFSVVPLRNQNYTLLNDADLTTEPTGWTAATYRDLQAIQPANVISNSATTLSIDGTIPLHVITTTVDITSITFSATANRPPEGQSCHAIIKADTQKTVTVAYHATYRVTPDGNDITLTIPAGGYVELDWVTAGGVTYVRGIQ